MYVYLDNNVICSIENGDIKLSEISELIGKSAIEFPYSHAHIQEADNIKDSLKGDRESLINKRLKTIKEFSKKVYFYHDLSSDTLIVKKEEPSIVLETIRTSSIAKSAMKTQVNLFSNDQKAQVRQQLGIDIREINNYNSTQIVEHFTNLIAITGMESTFQSLIEKGVAMHPDGKRFGLMHRIAAIMELLDLFGYWKDKETENSNYARLWDSIHTYFSSNCDFFISDDKQTRMKARVVFELFNIKTIVLSSKGIK